MMKYLTRRKDPKKPDDYIYDGSKGTIRAERDIKEEEINKDPNILRRIKYYSETYDDVKLGKDFDKAIAAEDKNLAALGRAKPNMYERKHKFLELPAHPPPDRLTWEVLGTAEGLGRAKSPY